MTVRLPELPTTEYEPAHDDAGIGALRTERGNLPLESIDVDVAITGLTARVRLSQGFHNPYDVPLEATYVFPLPDRAAVTAMRMEADGRVVEGVLKERGQARADYRQAISEGRRAAIAEEERPDVFTMRVGNIVPGERVTVRLTMDQPLPYADGEAAFRFPLVVAPRYVPGEVLGGEQAGAGWAADTDAVPDASRISPPVLLPGFPNPVRLAIDVDVDPGGLPLAGMRSSLHAVQAEPDGTEPDGTEPDRAKRRVSIQPGERADRDFVLRLAYGQPDDASAALVITRDAGEARTAGDEAAEGTFQLTVLPPASAGPARPRDVVLVLDRSGSMGGWKMVAARRAAARIVDTLTDADRFAVLAFDNTVERPAGLPSGLVPATDRNRFRAVEHLARTDARGGTEMLRPLTEATGLLTEGSPAAHGEQRARGSDRVLVLVTDGQVGNEDQLLASLTPSLGGIRVHTIGIDRAVNAGFLTRLAMVGGGRCELVESEDRLDEAAEHIHRRICTPLVTDLRLSPLDAGVTPVPDTIAPARLPDLFPGVPLVITGRWSGGGTGGLELAGRDGTGTPWRAAAQAVAADAPALGPIWARAHLRDLEDRYLAARADATGELERRIVATSLRFHVLCRFTAYVAIDSRTVTDGGAPHQVVQPVEPASGWDMLTAGPPIMLAAQARSFGKSLPTAGTIGGMAAGMGAPQSAGIDADEAMGGAMRPTARGRISRSPGGPVPPAPMPRPADPFGWVRTLAAEEARRMRAATGRPVAERQAMLSDLGSRLEAMVLALTSQAAAATTVEPLRELAEALRAVHAGTVDELWQRALTVLDAFAGTPAAAPEPPPRRPFWKR